VQILQIGGLPEILAAMQAVRFREERFLRPLSPERNYSVTGTRRSGNLGIKYPATSFLTTSPILEPPSRADSIPQRHRRGGPLRESEQGRIDQRPEKIYQDNEMPILEDTYQIYVQRYIRLLPTSSPEEVKTVLDQVKDKDPRARTTDYDSFIRGDLLREIEQTVSQELKPRLAAGRRADSAAQGDNGIGTCYGPVHSREL